MKRSFLIVLMCIPFISFGQFGISFHQSGLPFMGFNYEINNKIRPEIRIGTDNYFDAITLEGVITYDIIQNNDYEFYAGLGGRVNGFSGVVIPIGLNVYPFTEKQFGFHIEAAPIIGENNIFRGSWGIRYRFKKNDSE